jgi:hypothetical protein
MKGIDLYILLSFSFGCLSAQVQNPPDRCIMVFGAHADDVDEIAGGTFAKYISEGYKGVYVCVTNNLIPCLRH